MTIRTMVVEDEGLYREMLCLALNQQPDMQVIYAAEDGVSALQKAKELQPDVILMDIELGRGPNGIETGIAIKEENPKIGIVILSSHREKQYIESIPVNMAGGWSYLLKQSVHDVSSLTRAIQGAMSGLVVIDPQLVMALLPRPGGKLDRLTPRQREVLQIMAQGYNNSAIAQKLVLGEKSVENYINAIYQELEISREDLVHSRVKAVLLYLKESSQQF